MAKDYRINNQIRVPEVRIIGNQDDSQSVVMATRDALQLARDEGLDLVEVAPNQNPPVAKLLDYGRFKYVQSKKEKEAKKSQARNELREVRARPKIGQHDLESKIRKVKSLLLGGAKVKVTVILRGRENQHPELAVKVLRQVAESVASEAKLEKTPTREQRSLSIVLAPAQNSVGAPIGSSGDNA